MPSMADLSLSDGTTARTFAVLTPSSGDKTVAQWRWEDTTKIPLVRPGAQVLSRWNPDKTARHVDLKVTVPYYITDANTQQIYRGAYLFAGTAVVPMLMPEAFVTQGVNFSANFVNAALIKSVLASGYAPT